MSPVRKSDRGSRGALPWAGAAVGAAVVGLILPKVLPKARRAAFKLGASTYRTSPLGSARTNADPASGRPA